MEGGQVDDDHPYGVCKFRVVDAGEWLRQTGCGAVTYHRMQFGMRGTSTAEGMLTLTLEISHTS